VRVRVTVTVVGARSRPLGELLGSIRAIARRRAISVVAVAAGVLAASIAGALVGWGTGEHRSASAAQVGGEGPAGVAAAYGYPLRCLTITISAASPDYARAHVDRARGCARYHGYVNASFHRIGGTWRLVLDEGQLFVRNDLLARRP
jgi:hypothetical protein